MYCTVLNCAESCYVDGIVLYFVRLDCAECCCVGLYCFLLYSIQSYTIALCALLGSVSYYMASFCNVICGVLCCVVLC